MKKIKINIVILIALSMFVFSGCADTGPRLQTFEMSDIEDGALANAKARVLSSKETLKAVMDRDYGSDFVAETQESELESLEETNQRLNREYEDLIEETLEKEWGGVFIARIDSILYRDTLKLARDQKLSIKDLTMNERYGLNPYKNPVKAPDFILLGFIDLSGKIQEDKFIKSISKLICDADDQFYIYPSNVLKTYTEEQVRAFKNPLIELRRVSDYTYSMAIFGTSFEIVKNARKQLEEKYNKDFEILYRSGITGGDMVASPLNDLDTIFEVESNGVGTGSSDLYLTVLAQQKMSNFVNQQIEAAGLSDSLIQYTGIDNWGSFSDMNQKPFDFQIQMDDRKFLNEVYDSHFMTILIYLLKPGEEPDYGKIQKVVNGVTSTLDSTNRHIVEVCFYHVEKKRIKDLKMLFLRDYAPNYYVNDDFANRMSLLTVIRSDTEGFDYLDVYCERDPLYAEVIDKADPELSLNEFKALFIER